MRLWGRKGPYHGSLSVERHQNPREGELLFTESELGCWDRISDFLVSLLLWNHLFDEQQSLKVLFPVSSLAWVKCQSYIQPRGCSCFRGWMSDTRTSTRQSPPACWVSGQRPGYVSEIILKAWASLWVFWDWEDSRPMQGSSLSPRGSGTPGWLPSLDPKMILDNTLSRGSTLTLKGLSPQIVPRFKSTVSYRIFGAVSDGDSFLTPVVVSPQTDLQVRAQVPTQQEAEGGTSHMSIVCCVSEQPLVHTKSGVGLGLSSGSQRFVVLDLGRQVRTNTLNGTGKYKGNLEEGRNPPNSLFREGFQGNKANARS